MKQHVFICGCPRSGTTMLAELLNWHERISIGIERYGNLFFSEPLTPALYENARYHDLRSGDTFYESLDFSASYAEKQKTYDSIGTVGDKIPLLFDHFESLSANFPDAKIIFCLRNVLEVASSYEARKCDPADTSWGEAMDGVQAVSDWNRSVAAYMKWRNRLDIFLFDYDAYLLSGKTQIRDMLAWLGVEWTQYIGNKVAGTQKWGRTLAERRRCILSAETVAAIAENANFMKYRRAVAESGAASRRDSSFLR